MKFNAVMSSLFVAFLLAGCGYFEKPPLPPPVKHYQVAAFYVPSTKEDWDKMAATKSSFVGHMQPKESEYAHNAEWLLKSLRSVVRKKIAPMQNAGIDALIMHYYHFEDGPYLPDTFEVYLNRISFAHPLDVAIYWDNRDHPVKGSGVLQPETFKELTDTFVDHFKKRSYWKIDNKPFFGIASLENFVAGYEDLRQANRALERLRNRTILAGFDDAYIVGYSHGLSADRADELVDGLELDAISSYTWSDDIALPDFPATDYAKAHDLYQKAILEGGGTNLLTRPASRFKADYLPTVIMGYDPGPLTDPAVDWKSQRGYPYGPYINSNSPSQFTKALLHAKEAASAQTNKLVIINAWNDWTHGSYLEPEEMYQNGYIDAVKHVFVDLEELDIKEWIRYRIAVKYNREYIPSTQE